MVGHGGIVAFDDRTDMRAVAKHLLHFGAAESCGKCFPCRIGLRRAHEMFANGDAGRARAARGSCSRRSSSAACARTAAACRRRSAACSRTSPTSWGSRDHARRSTARRRSVAPGTTVLEAVRATGREVPTLCFDERQAPFGACRVCLVGVEGAPGPVAVVHDAGAATGMEVDTHDADRAPRRDRRRRARALRAARAAGRAHRARAGRAACSTSASRAGPASTHAVEHDERHPYLAFQHELCISCGRCVRACDEVQGTFALTATGRGFGANIAAGLDEGFRDSACVVLRRVRRHLPDRRDHRDLPATPDRPR